MRGERRDQPLRQSRIVMLRRERTRPIRLFGTPLEIVNENEIDIGRRRHLAPAELAHRDHNRGAAGHASVFDLHLAADFAQQPGDQTFRNDGIREPCSRRRDASRQRPDADKKLLFAADDACGVEHLLHRIAGACLACRGERPDQQFVDRIFIQAAAEHMRIEHRIEQTPPLRQDMRETRRRSHDVGEKPDQTRLRLEQRKELHATRKFRQEAIEARDRGIGIDRIGESRDQQRLDLRQALAGTRRPDRRSPAVMPSAYDGKDLSRLRIAKALQFSRRLRVILGAAEDHVRAFSGQGRSILEEFGIMPFHRFEICRQLGRQLVRAGIAREMRERLKRRRIRG